MIIKLHTIYLLDTVIRISDLEVMDDFFLYICQSWVTNLQLRGIYKPSQGPLRHQATQKQFEKKHSVSLFKTKHAKVNQASLIKTK